MNNVTSITSIRASAVPSIPKEISALQRLAMLNLADEIRDVVKHPNTNRTYGTVLLETAEKMLREAAT